MINALAAHELGAGLGGAPRTGSPPPPRNSILPPGQASADAPHPEPPALRDPYQGPRPPLFFLKMNILLETWC